MINPTTERLFERWRREGDAEALAEVFDRTAPRLLALAVHLCGDAVQAEDLLQATFVAAMEHAADWDRSRPLLPWLSGILANKARLARREAAREIDPDRLLARAEVTPLDVAAERELSGALAEALDRIDEPYRGVLVLRLRHGLAVADIAHALGRSPATVRVQLHRGLKLLRAMLPASLIAALGILALPPKLLSVRAAVLERAARISAPWIGGMVMTKPVALAGGLLAALLAAWWLLDPRAEPSTKNPLVLHASSPEPVAQVNAVQEGALQALPASDRSTVEVPASSDASDSIALVIREAVDGKPLAGARVALREGGQEVHAADTGSDGRYVLSGAFGHTLTLSIVADGYFPQVIGNDVLEKAYLSPAEREFTLWPIGSLTIRVIDEEDMPVPWARLFVLPVIAGRTTIPAKWLTFVPPEMVGPESFRDPCSEVRGWTEPDGTREVPCLPSGIPLEVRAGRQNTNVKTIVTIPMAERTATVTLKLSPGCILSGRVVDSGDEGLWRVRVELLTWPESQTVGTGDDGRFRFERIPAGEYRLMVHSPGESLRTVTIACPETDLGVIRLAPLHPVEFQLRDASGSIVRASLLFTGLIRRAGILIHVGGFMDGRMSVDLPEGAMSITVSNGTTVARRDFRVPCESVVIPVDEMTGGLAFSAASPDSYPLRVALFREGSADPPFKLETLLVLEEQHDPRLVRGGDRHLVRWLQAGTYTLSIEGRGLGAHRSGIVISAGATTELGPLLLGAGRIQGRVLAADGTPLSGYVVATYPRRLRRWSSLQGKRVATSDADGGFSFPGLPAAEWSVFPDSRGPDCEEAQTVVVEPDDCVPCELTVSPSGSLEGTVTCRGAVAPGVAVKLAPRAEGARGRLARDAITSATGAYRFEGLAPDTYTIMIESAYEGSTDRAAPAISEVLIEPGLATRRHLERCPDTTRIRLTYDGEPVDVLMGTVAYPDGHGYTRPVPGLEGEYDVPLSSGPWLFAITTPLEVPLFSIGRKPGYLFAYAGVPGQAPPAGMDVAIGKGTIEVRSSGAAEACAPLPHAMLFDVNGLTWSGPAKRGLAYEDLAPGVRLFRGLPAGSRVALYADDGVAVLQKIIVVPTEDRVEVEWP